jgi:hypothetical protein
MGHKMRPRCLEASDAPALFRGFTESRRTIMIRDRRHPASIRESLWIARAKT